MDGAKKVMYSGAQKGSNQGEAGRRLKIGADRILITQGLQKPLVSLNGFRKVLFIKEIYFRAPHFELSLKHYSLNTTVRNRTDYICGI